MIAGIRQRRERLLTRGALVFNRLSSQNSHDVSPSIRATGDMPISQIKPRNSAD